MVSAYVGEHHQRACARRRVSFASCQTSQPGLSRSAFETSPESSEDARWALRTLASPPPAYAIFFCDTRWRCPVFSRSPRPGVLRPSAQNQVTESDRRQIQTMSNILTPVQETITPGCFSAWLAGWLAGWRLRCAALYGIDPHTVVAWWHNIGELRRPPGRPARLPSKLGSRNLGQPAAPDPWNPWRG
jgi:hypothetical protein